MRYQADGRAGQLRQGQPFLKTVVGFDGTANHDAELDRLALGKSVRFEAVETGRDDVALLGFTSGTTGEPKATMHFHRDLLIIADGYARKFCSDTGRRFRWLATTCVHLRAWGAGDLPAPLRCGRNAAGECIACEHDRDHPDLSGDDQLHRADRLSGDAAGDGRGGRLSSLRIAVSAGETLPGPVFEEWVRKTGKPILDGIGTTEMLHILITNRVGDTTRVNGKPVTGIGARCRRRHAGTAARQRWALAVRGPTGCRYLADKRQKTYVRDGWNLTGDTFCRTRTGYFHFVARSDDMIISAGYNIAGPEVEAALCPPDVAECAVIGAADNERGQIVQAHVVLAEGLRPTTRRAIAGPR